MTVCVVSMVMSHYLDKWTPMPGPYPMPTMPTPAMPGPQPTMPTMPTPAEVDEFRRLLERAREYDRLHGQPDCGLEEKRRKVRELADSLGVNVDFV